jgi:hypothetical protein
MGNYDLILFGLFTIIENQLPVVISHIQTVDHHQGADIDINTGTTKFQYLMHVRIFEKQLACYFIVFLIKGTAGYENSGGH